VSERVAQPADQPADRPDPVSERSERRYGSTPTGEAVGPGPAIVTPPPTKPPRFAGLDSRYWKLWSASVISNLGDGIGQIAYPWLASLLTRDPVLIAGVAVAQRLPWLVFSLHAGAIVDRGDRRRLMVSMNTLRFGVTALVTVAVALDVMVIPALYVAALALGFAEVVYDNAAQTILPRLVPADRLERANGNMWGAEMVMNQFIGPPLGGFLIALAIAWPFGVDAATFGLSAALIFLIRGTFRAGSEGAAPAPRRSMRVEIGEGLRWLWDHRLIRILAILLGIMNGMGAAMLATEVLFVQEILGLDARGFGLLATASAIGGVLGSQVAPSLTKRIGPGLSLYLTLAGGVVTAVGIGTTSNAIVVGVMFAIYMFTAVIWNVITVSLRQTIIPDHLLGRVNSVYRFFGWGMMPIGALLGGAIVSLSEPAAGREVALRLPFFVSAAVHVVALAFALGRLSTAKIEAARAAAMKRQESEVTANE
jgi:MFS family permease